MYRAGFFGELCSRPGITASTVAQGGCGIIVSRPLTATRNAKEKAQHPAFPRGPPPQYYLNSTPLNFAVRMGSGEPG